METLRPILAGSTRVEEAMKELAVPREAQRIVQRLCVEYIHERQTEDGGYFFARIPPSNLADSYYAVKTLEMLEHRCKRPAALRRFMNLFLRGQLTQNAHGLYLATGILEVLGQKTDLLKGTTNAVMMRLCRRDNGQGLKDVYIEVASELQDLYEAVWTLQRYNMSAPRTPLTQFVSSLQNGDGGFGREGRSTLATTYYAVQTFSELRLRPNESHRIVGFLRRQEEHIHFLEDLYYLVGALHGLGESPANPEWVIRFVLACQRDHGGFARAVPIGIPTLEYTYYAVSVLKWMGFFPAKRVNGGAR